jgi:hypothetical protein
MFAAHALSTDLEGRDVLVTGVVSAMPQRNEAGLRLRLAVEAAQLDGVVVQLPALLSLGWYGGGCLWILGEEENINKTKEKISHLKTAQILPFLIDYQGVRSKIIPAHST